MRQVNVTLTNARLTGNNVSVPQFAVDIVIDATKDDGTTIHDERTANFPNILNNAAISTQARNEKLKELMLWAVRQIVADGLEDRD